MKNLKEVIKSNFDDNQHFNNNEKSIILNCILESYLAALADIQEFNEKYEKEAIKIIDKKINEMEKNKQ